MTLVQRPPAHRFYGVEHQVAAIEKRNREEVDKSNAHRNERRQLNDVFQALVATRPATSAIRIGPPS